MPIYEFATLKTSQKKHRSSVFSWGFSATGALGNEVHLRRRVSKDDGSLMPPKAMVKRAPQRLRFVTPETTVYDVAAGSGFTVLAATVHKTPYVLFGCGLNTDSQIGYQETIQHEPLVCVANVVPIRVPIEASKSEISTHESPKEKMIKVAAGRAHTFCLTNSGKVYSLGNNSYGQCGRSVVPNEKYFASRRINLVKVLNEDTANSERIVDIVCGQDHTLLLTDSGSVYACGLGADGQLGAGHYGSLDRPTRVTGDIEGERIVSLSSAADCVLAINDKGQVFGWGNSEYGQLNMVTPQTQVNVSRHLKLESTVGKAISVGAGGSMCGLVNEEGTVFVWGYGMLGMGPSVSELKAPTPLKDTLFGKTIFNPVVRVQSITAGLHHFAAITNKGELFTWGKNNKANLGIGVEHDMTFPYRVSIPGSVRKVSLGPDHTVALSRALI